MIHPDTEVRFINDEIGYGVVAKKLIPKGTITWVQDDLDMIFTPVEVKKFPSAIQKMIDIYSFRNNKGEHVLCWDIAKYVNHSFDSNCLSTAYDFEIAIRDIHPGEQLTDDYGYLNISEPFEACDEGTERKVVYPDDLIRYHKVWDEKLTETFPFVTKQNQPLKAYFSEEKWKLVEQIGVGKKKMDSILLCFYGA